METPRSTSHASALLSLGVLILLTVGVSLLPASWFGVKPEVQRYAPLNLGTSDTIETASQSFDPNGAPSWKSFIAGSLGIQNSQLQNGSTTFQTDPRDIADLNDPNNLTSSFSKNLYIASVALQQNGINDPNVDQQTVTQLLKQEASKIQKTTYTDKDIKIGKDDSSVALKAYGNAVASALNGFATQDSIAGDIASIQKFTQTNAEGDLAPVALHTQKVEGALQKLLAITVPPSAVAIDLQVVNSVGTYAQTLQDLSRAYDDPVRATFAVNNYVDSAVQAIQSFPKLGQFFVSKHITFTLQDPGYVYIVGYTGN